MFIPLFIALLLGWATPANTNSNCAQGGGTTVSVNSFDDPSTPPGDDPTTPPPGDDTGGEGGQIKPPK